MLSAHFRQRTVPDGGESVGIRIHGTGAAQATRGARMASRHRYERPEDAQMDAPFGRGGAERGRDARLPCELYRLAFGDHSKTEIAAHRAEIDEFRGHLTDAEVLAVLYNERLKQ